METKAARTEEAGTKPVGFGEAFRFWVKLGFINFGGPAGQIAIMHREFVEKKRWISEGQYLRTLNFCMLLPGPEAQQVATYIGWRLHGTLGGIVAGSFFVIPSIFVLLLLSWLAVAHSDVPAVRGLLYGVQPVVIAIVVEAVMRIGKRALGHPALWGFAVAAFVALYFLSVPFPLVVIAAAVGGLVLQRFVPRAFGGGGHGGAEEAAGADGAGPAARPRPRRVGRARLRTRSSRGRGARRGGGGVGRGPSRPLRAAFDAAQSEVGRHFRGALGRSGWGGLDLARRGGRARAGGAVLYGGRFRDLRRGIRGPELHLQRRRQRLRVADGRPDGAGPRARRVHAGAAHHGHPVRRVSGGVEQGARGLRSPALRDARRPADDLRHLSAVLPVHLPARALHRAAGGQPEDPGRPYGGHGRGGRRDRQPGRLFRQPGALPRRGLPEGPRRLRPCRGGGLVRGLAEVQGADLRDGAGRCPAGDGVDTTVGKLGQEIGRG